MPIMTGEPSSSSPRGRVARTGRAVLLVVSVLAPAILARELTEDWLGADTRGTHIVAPIAFIALPTVVTAVLAPYASYRSRDALLWFIGPGLYVFLVIAWRLALLPYRDWAPRSDETPRARWLRDPIHAGVWYLPTERR